MPPDAVVAEIARVPGAGTERALLERVRIRMKQLGHPAHIVVADDPTTALNVARWQRTNRIIPPNEGDVALAPLPLAALPMPPKDRALLESLGILTIGQFAALPPSAVTGRFSPAAVIAHAMSSGRSPRPTLHPWSENGPLILTQDLPEPIVEFEALTFVVGALVRDLTARLIARGQAITHVELGLRLSGGRSQPIGLRLGAPTRDASAIMNRIRHRATDLKLGGPVVAVTLTTDAASAFDGRQIDLRDPLRQDDAIADVSAKLLDALGSQSVLSARSIPRHRPEGAWRPVPFGTPVPRSTGSAAQCLVKAHAADPVFAWEGQPEATAPDRPPIMLSPPEAIEVDVDQNNQPTAVHVSGRWQSVEQRLGPEQLSGEWWSRPFQRTYWQAALNDGRRCWLYKEHGRWWLHGWWDR